MCICKYDPVLDRFMDRAAKLVEISMESKDANYLWTQLNKRIEAKRLEGIKVSVVNNVNYLEKI